MHNLKSFLKLGDEIFLTIKIKAVAVVACVGQQLGGTAIVAIDKFNNQVTSSRSKESSQHGKAAIVRNTEVMQQSQHEITVDICRLNPLQEGAAFRVGKTLGRRGVGDVEQQRQDVFVLLIGMLNC